MRITFGTSEVMIFAFTNYLLGVLFLGALIPALFKLVSCLKSYLRKRNLYYKFPQEPSNLIFGHLLQYPGSDEKGLTFLRKKVEVYPKCRLIWLMQTPMIVVYHPDTVKIILKKSEPKGKGIYSLLRPWIGDGLLTSKGEKWARNRRLLTPAFHFEILKNYIEVKNRCADLLLNKFDHAAKECQPFLVFSNISVFTLDVILRCTMSYKTNCQSLGDRHPYVQAVNQMSELLMARYLKPWLHSDFIYFLTPSGRQFKKHCDFVHKVAEEIISKRRETIRNGDLLHSEANETRYKCMDFLDILLTAKDETGADLTSTEIRDEVDTFLFEGHDTTSSALSWALYSIAEHQDVQRKIQEEVDNRLTGRKNEDDILWEDLAELPYLTMVIKETLRLHSPVPYIQRQLTVDTEIDGTIAPAGTMVAVLLYNIHHNPLVWKDSMTFDPDRFSAENFEKRSVYAFVPFSAGPRNCIGQNFAMDELKIALARILHRFSIRLEPDFKAEKFFSLVMRAQEDIRLLVTDRHTQAAPCSSD